MLILSFGVLTALTELSLRFLMLRSKADKVLNTAIISVSRAHEEIKNKQTNKQKTYSTKTVAILLDST